MSPLFRLILDIGEGAAWVQRGRRRVLALGLGLLALGALAACSFNSSDSPLPPPVPDAQKALVMRVDRLILGRTHDGFVLAAYGVTDTAGWRAPALRPDGRGPGPDGFLSFDLVAVPPETGVITPESGRQVRADALVSAADLRAATGLRVRALNGAVEARLGEEG